MLLRTTEMLHMLMLLPIHLVLGKANDMSTNGDNSTSNGTGSHHQARAGSPYDNDPYLVYQPNFSRSLPIQLLIAGIVLTLCTTLLIQLLFTWQYHWPLARINWTLQFTSVCTLLLNVVAILYVVLTALAEKSKLWPYMFEYIAISVPRGSWSVAEVAAWCVMEATTSTLATITHIQFLTCLYPSRLEARLVFCLLGPLAIVAFVMTLMPISTYSYSYSSGVNLTSGFNLTALNDTVPHLSSAANTLEVLIARNISSDDDDIKPSRNQQLMDIFDSARNVCNLTLSLLFTLSLLIWGFLVNRSNAWRTDGGTAAFGAGALGLALVSTALNFLNVLSHPRFEWLTSLLWSVVLWQSFLGWWWWVGSASGIASREIDMENRGRKEQKRAKRKRRKVSQTSGGEDEALMPLAARLDRWRSSMGVTLSRRRTHTNAPFPTSQSQTSTLQGEPIELTTINSNITATDHSIRTSDHSPPSTTSLATTGSWYSNSTQFFSAARRAWRSLRQAHVRAARVQAIEQRQIQIQMERENGRGLGRFPGGTGGERERSTLRSESRPGPSSEGRATEERYAEGEAATRNVERPREDAVWWWGPLRKWRLQDSTVY